MSKDTEWKETHPQPTEEKLLIQELRRVIKELENKITALQQGNYDLTFNRCPKCGCKEYTRTGLCIDSNPSYSEAKCNYCNHEYMVEDE